MENITLYLREGSSDKVYQAAIESRDGGHVVTFAFGRRGSTLSTGTRTPAPVSHADAKAVYEKLVKEKMAKGCTPGQSGTPYRQTAKEQQTSGILPQLLNPVDEDRLEFLLDDHDHWMQEKMDGRRLLLKKQNGEITGINRLVVALPLVLTHCGGGHPPPPDFTPFGDGLKAVGICLVCFAVVKVLGALVKGDKP